MRRILDDVEALISGTQDFDPASSDASFRISGSDFFAELLMPRLADRLLAQAPSMRAHLVDLVPDGYVDTLERYEVDLALIPKTSLPDWVESRPVFKSSFSVVARTQYPRLRHAEIRPGDTIPLDLFCDLGHVVFSS